jgi:hypothetical protein
MTFVYKFMLIVLFLGSYLVGFVDADGCSDDDAGEFSRTGIDNLCRLTPLFCDVFVDDTKMSRDNVFSVIETGDSTSDLATKTATFSTCLKTKACNAFYSDPTTKCAECYGGLASCYHSGEETLKTCSDADSANAVRTTAFKAGCVTNETLWEFPRWVRAIAQPIP